MLEYKFLQQILAEQQKTNALLMEQNELLRKGGAQHGRTITEQSDVPESEGTIQRKRGPKRHI